MNEPENCEESASGDVSHPRPNPSAAYLCGLAQIGKSCTLGPSAWGKCCQDQWVAKCGDSTCSKVCAGSGHCEVSQLKNTGCQEDRQDALPCTPVKNPWYARNTFAMNCALLTAGALLLCMTLLPSQEFFAPGKLSSSHAQILVGNLGTDRCAACHPSAHGAAASTQEQLCQSCHQSHMPDALAGNPHDLMPWQFPNQDSGQAIERQKLTFVSHTQGTKCAQCHQEHHGHDHDLQAISDQRCQSCHQIQFSSFSSGHPEFTHFPSSDRRRIAPDHVAHQQKHFAQKNASFECRSCHDVDQEGGSGISRTVSFERACQSCHDQPLRAATTDGWAILQLPSLNMSDAANTHPSLVQWPAGARFGFDGPLTFPMRLLLSADPLASEALISFPSSDLSRVQSDNPAQVAAVRTIALAMRQLFQDTAYQGQAAWQSRLESVAVNKLGRELKIQERQLITTMLSGLPIDLFKQIESQWFGNEKAIVQVHDKPIPARLVATQDLLLDDDDSSQAESAEDLLRSSSTKGLKYETPPTQTPSQAPGQSPVQTPADPVIAPQQTASGRPQASAQESDLLLSEDDDLTSQQATDDLHTAPLLPGAQSDQSNSVKMTAAKQLAGGGWYLDSQLYSLKYMPRGHADPVVGAWIQFASLLQTDQAAVDQLSTHSEAAGAFLPEFSPGSEVARACRECHLPHENAVNIAQADYWRSWRDDGLKHFTKFDHRPHLTLASTADCRHCHQLNSQRSESYAAALQSYRQDSNRDRKKFVASYSQCFAEEFEAIEKSQCSACHQAGGASQSCTQCHNYHVGSQQLESSLQDSENSEPPQQAK
ncbi:MAG TPA: hypothetical protein DCF63_10630 [Planctomycetaceae bacterium]|nr:hypothetical protein [Planctomycetaceae bacterium]